jgi:hypothetical protein
MAVATGRAVSVRRAATGSRAATALGSPGVALVGRKALSSQSEPRGGGGDEAARVIRIHTE